MDIRAFNFYRFSPKPVISFRGLLATAATNTFLEEAEDMKGNSVISHEYLMGTLEAKMRKCFSSLTVVLLALIILPVLSPNTTAQTTTSTLQGTVTDANGAVVAGAEVKLSGTTLAAERTATTDEEGFYRIPALPAGTYIVTISRTGFETSTSNVELTLNRVQTFDVQMKVGTVGEVVDVTTDSQPLLEPNASSTGAVVTPRQITDFPVNGRNYLDLMQLVPGVAINRQVSPTSDNANPVLGERSGNNNFFIDGQPNKDTVNGGAAAQFNQETIAEFQVLTSAYKAEFGQASGAIVNVITKSGGNEFHGVGSFFHRNEAFDSVNSLDPAVTDPLHLRRFDYSLAMGGPIWKDRIFFFGSSERITEDRAIDFTYPNLGTSAGAVSILALLRAQEDQFDVPQKSRATRNFLKLNEQFGRHQLSQEINYTNEYVRGSGTGLPTTRTSTSGRHLLFGLGDTILIGEQGNPWILTLRGAYRGEPSDVQPAHLEFTGGTTLNAFLAQQICPPTCGFFSNLPGVGFGNASTPSNLKQKYTSLSANANKLLGDHDIKFGWQFLRTHVDGEDAKILTNQLFTTIDDYINFGPVNSGIFLLLTAGGITPEALQIRLRNNYNGLYVQDDWRIRKNLTVNLGIRWDHDSEFDAQKNFSPRLGVAWSITPKTVLRSHFGVFYDQFRLGLVSQVPEFGGADRRVVQSLYFPRGFYGSPSLLSMLAFASGLPGPCLSNVLTDAQITAMGTTCILGGGPIVGVDRLNNVVAPGHAPIPANAVININNIQTLTGLTPAQYLTQAAAAIGQPDGYFEWGAFGALNNPIIPPQLFPTSVDSTFSTPHTLGFSIGVQRELTKDVVVTADYYHREIKNLLGPRLSNLAFRSRVAGIGRRFDPPNTTGEIRTFGPFFEGEYDGLVVSVNKRFNNRYLIGANYTYAKATDNSLGVNTNPTDNFIGIVPEVTEPCPTANPTCTRQTNANGSFTSRNGNFVAQAGTFLNGPDLDEGPSSLALDHIFQVNGLVDLPWKFQISGIFRAQSGFHFSRFDALNRDPDGNANFNGIDFTAGRNAFTTSPFVNFDLRFAKRFDISERVKLQLLFEFFNLLNRQNPAQVQNRENILNQLFGSTTQVLPGREGQIGFRIEF
jgi:Carboxypeptidase regulatory-like domain/TonB dependent receptor/TonB-dependent Receptor Plug Domain